jgi:NitT/TauT family transport system ATP-binding protein
MTGAARSLDVLIRRKAFRAAGGATTEVIKDLAFAMRAGEAVAFLGPSGAGKSTLLRLVAGLDDEFQGTITRPAGRIGMVFQEPLLLPWRDVETNIRLVAGSIGEARLRDLLKILGLEDHRRHFPRELSLGLARRVALARAFAVDPALLLLDEPFVSLDRALACRLRGELARLIDRAPVTTLLVTHDPDEAFAIADRVVLLAGPPTRIIGESAVATPRAERGPDEIARLRAIAGV